MSLLISGLTSLASLLLNATSGSANKERPARRNGESPDAGPAAKVSLSQEAKALAGLASQGAVFAQSVSGSQAVRQGTDGSPVAAMSRRSVSNEDFEALLGRFGADAKDQKTLMAGFDANQDGAISQDEFLKGLAQTAGGNTSGEFSQALLRLMDGAGDANANVSQQEFAEFSKAYGTAASAGA